jgi:hypothetical protein
VPHNTSSFSFPYAGVAVAVLTMLTLSGCMTSKKPPEPPSAEADGAASASTAEAAAPAVNNGTKPAGALATGRYVDPLITKAPRHANQPALAATSATAPPATGFPDAPSQPAGSIAGVVTQPTGVRAGSFSIFSSGQGAGAGQEGGQAAGAPQPGTGLGARNGGVFAPRQPLPPATCPVDNKGQPLNC